MPQETITAEYANALRERALAAATLLGNQEPRVQEVRLYGSLTHPDQGHTYDIDLCAIVADSETYCQLFGGDAPLLESYLSANGFPVGDGTGEIHLKGVYRFLFSREDFHPIREAEVLFMRG